jgi:hypothetical protein
MAHTSPVEVLLGYRRDPDPEVRANLATALGALGSPESVDALVDLSVDEVKGVRDRAVAEIEELLKGEGGSTIVGELGNRLRSGDAGTKTRALDLIGRVRLSGAPLRAQGETWRERLDYISSLWNFRFQPAVLALVLALPAWALVSVYVAWQTDNVLDSDFYLPVLGAGVVSAFLVGLLFLRTAPLWQAYEPFASLVADVVLSLPMIALGIGTIAWGWWPSAQSTGALVWFVLAGTVVSAISLGCAYLSIAVTDSPSGARVESFLKQYLAGTCAGAAALYGLTAAWRALSSTYTFEIEMLRLTGVIALGGVAAVAARSARGRAAFANAGWARRARYALLTLVAVVAVTLLPDLAGETQGRFSETRILAPAGEPVTRMGEFGSGRALLAIDAKFVQSIVVTLRHGAATTNVGRVRLLRGATGPRGCESSGQEEAANNDDGLVGTLGVGCYGVEISLKDLSSSSGMDEVLTSLAQGRTGYEWTVTVNREGGGPVEGGRLATRWGSMPIALKDAPPSELQLEIPATGRVVLSTLQDEEFVTGSGPGRSPKSPRTEIMVRPANRPESEARTFEGYVDELFEPGKYIVRGGGTSDTVRESLVAAVTNVLGTGDVGVVGLASTDLDAMWLIDRFPSERSFQLKAEANVRIELARGGGPDMIVVLQSEDGKEIQKQDDPETIDRKLTPGTYVISAQRFDKKSEPSNPPTRLTVRATPP